MVINNITVMNEFSDQDTIKNSYEKEIERAIVRV